MTHVNWGRFIVLSAFVLLMGVQTHAQGRVEVRAIGGYSLVYVDVPWAGTGGGALHFRIASNFLAGGEVLYIAGAGNHDVLTVMPVVSWEFRGTSSVRPYLVGGIGVARRTGGSFSSGDSSRVTGNGGIGVKLRVLDRFFIAPEFRFGGIEPIVTTTVSLGIRL
jgi:hypothetical protein